MFVTRGGGGAHMRQVRDGGIVSARHQAPTAATPGHFGHRIVDAASAKHTLKTSKMTLGERIALWLRQVRGAYCDDCIVKEFKLPRHQQVTGPDCGARGVFLLLVVKVVTKIVGVYPVTKQFGSRHNEAMYTTLLMSTWPHLRHDLGTVRLVPRYRQSGSILGIGGRRYCERRDSDGHCQCLLSCAAPHAPSRVGES
jgi:hypothetical protein